jgi:hypothetical protein
MKTEKLFHELLGLRMNWEVQECEFDHIQGVVRIKIAETAHLWEMERKTSVPKRKWFLTSFMSLLQQARPWMKLAERKHAKVRVPTMF